MLSVVPTVVEMVVLIEPDVVRIVVPGGVTEKVVAVGLTVVVTAMKEKR